MGERLIKWNTARKMVELLSIDVDDMSYFNNFAHFNNDIESIYRMCYSYIERYYGLRYSQVKQLDGDLYKDFTKYLDKLYEFENTDTDPTILAHKADELFENRSIKKVTSVEHIWIERAKVLDEYVSEIHAMMKACSYGTKISDTELSKEIAIYLEAKGLSLYQVDQELLLTES